jgi:anti-sigma factor RsiW
VKHGSSHPGEAALVARYYGGGDPTLDAHVARCPRCAARENALRAALDAEKGRLSRITDAYFTPARLDAQRAEVLHRLEAPRRARVLAFPFPDASPAPSPRVSGRRLRWLAAAAAAAMIAVAGAGRFAEESWRLSPAVSGQRASLQPAGSGQAAVVREPDDAELAAIDVALARPGARELVALDALTLRSVTPPYGQ